MRERPLDGIDDHRGAVSPELGNLMTRCQLRPSDSSCPACDERRAVGDGGAFRCCGGQPFGNNRDRARGYYRAPCSGRTRFALIGAGGMGEVYRAHDTRLGRDVAIKVLPASSRTTERLRRFEQEARATAALNHPNIVASTTSAPHEGQPFIVSELLEGETLRDACCGGALPVRKAIDTRSRSRAALGRAPRASSIATSSRRTSS